jgi:predicted P-loop ATPase
MTKFIVSSSKNPCPVCLRTKDGDCRITEQGDLIFCHSHQDGKKGDELNGFTFVKTCSDGAGWGLWGRAKAKRKERKTPEKEQIFYYHGRDAKPLIRVHRQKGKSPEFWQSYFINGAWVVASKVPDHVKQSYRKSVPIYRFAEVQQAIEEGKEIVWVEGEKPADALWAIGIPATTSIGGCKGYKKWGDYKEDLADAMLTISPDRDKPGLAYAEEVAADFPGSRWLYAFPESKAWENLPESDGVDVVDWIEDFKLTKADVLAAIGSKKTAHMKLEDFQDLPEKSGKTFVSKQSKTMLVLESVAAGWGDRLRFNTMLNKPELDGKVLSLDDIAIIIAEEFDIDVSTEKAIAIVMRLAKKRPYSPVVEYLNTVEMQYGSDTSLLDGMASRYFKTSLPIYNTFLKRMMIGAVARQLAPGCKLDTSLIIKGDQGWGKSSFYQTLCGSDWFDDSLNDSNDKDQKLKLTRFWFVEYGEFESVYKKKDVSALKAFMSSSTDSLRPPYGRSIEDFPRTSILVGSTNRDDFLLDSTGSRRFWIVEIQQAVDVEAIKRDRDQLWAAAVAAYRSGEQWWLTDEEAVASEELNKDYQMEDVWTKPVLHYISGLSQTTTAAVMEHGLKLETYQQDRAGQMRVSEIMKNLGWVQRRCRNEGDRVRVWERKPDPILPPVPTCPNLDHQLSAEISPDEKSPEENLGKLPDQVGTGRDSLIVVEYEVSMEQALQPSQPVSQHQEKPNYSEKDIEDIKEALANVETCPTKEVLSELRLCWDRQAMNLACKRLTPERHAQIAQWVLELNAERAEQVTNGQSQTT